MQLLEIERDLKVDTAIGGVRGEKASGERIGFAEEGRPENTDRLGKINVVENISSHGREIERVAAGGCLIDSRRTTAATKPTGAKSTAASPGTTRSTGASRPADRALAVPATLGPMPIDLLTRRFMLN